MAARPRASPCCKGHSHAPLLRPPSGPILWASAGAPAGVAVHAPGLPARPPHGAALRPGLPLPAGRLDRPAHRGRALRARLPARPAAGAGDRRPRPLLRRHAEPQGARRRLEADAHPGQRPVPAPLRQGVPRRDEGHRRRRQRRRGPLRRPAHRPDRHRRPQLLAGDRDARLRPRRHADRPGRHPLPAGSADAKPGRPSRALQRLRRHRPGHRRRQDRLRPHHHVQPAIRRTSTTSGSTSSRPRAIAS